MREDLLLAADQVTREKLVVACHFVNSHWNWISFDMDGGEVSNSQVLIPQHDYGFMNMKVSPPRQWHGYIGVGLCLKGNVGRSHEGRVTTRLGTAVFLPGDGNVR
jgi:hypothetical protein